MKAKMELSEIKAIVGLGNSGNQYDNIRHNIGFMIVDAWAEHGGVHL
jgi:PTH1 family peptidyl-tRNA hydrolase